MDYSLPGSSVHGISQVRILEWVAILEDPGDLPNPGTEPVSPALQADLSRQGSQIGNVNAKNKVTKMNTHKTINQLENSLK